MTAYKLILVKSLWWFLLTFHNHIRDVFALNILSELVSLIFFFKVYHHNWPCVQNLISNDIYLKKKKKARLIDY